MATFPLMFIPSFKKLSWLSLLGCISTVVVTVTVVAAVAMDPLRKEMPQQVRCPFLHLSCTYLSLLTAQCCLLLQCCTCAHGEKRCKMHNGVTWRGLTILVNAATSRTWGFQMGHL